MSSWLCPNIHTFQLHKRSRMCVFLLDLSWCSVIFFKALKLLIIPEVCWSSSLLFPPRLSLCVLFRLGPWLRGRCSVHSGLPAPGTFLSRLALAGETLTALFSSGANAESIFNRTRSSAGNHRDPFRFIPHMRHSHS